MSGTTQGKGAKKGKKKERRSGRRNREICDIFGEAAMTNAYNICHNVQDLLYYRGFPWAHGGQKKKFPLEESGKSGGAQISNVSLNGGVASSLVVVGD